MMMSKKVVVMVGLCIAGIIQMGGLVHVATGDAGSGGSNSLTTRCTTAVQQVVSCLMFVTGKGTEPTKECCTAVNSMRTQAVCLCFIIGQAHNGSEQIKSLGIKEDKLIQLPSACHLPNANISNCPELLGISPSSPAASIFLNNNGTSSPGSTSPSSAAATTATSNSSGIKHYGSNGLFGVLAAISVSIFLSAFPTLEFLF